MIVNNIISMKLIKKLNNNLYFQEMKNPKYVALPMLQAQMKNIKYFQENARNQMNAPTTNALEKAGNLATKYRKENSNAKNMVF